MILIFTQEQLFSTHKVSHISVNCACLQVCRWTFHLFFLCYLPTLIHNITWQELPLVLFVFCFIFLPFGMFWYLTTLISKQFVRYGLVILFNVTMWGCYVNSLKALSSLQATVTNFATNFLSSGLAGYFLFGEALSFKVNL